MTLQDLTPILPEATVQNASQLSLRKAILQCVSDLARRVGDSLHLLEALGGIVGKLLEPGPLTTAFLECVAAAAVAVNFFPAKVCWRCKHISHTCWPTCHPWLQMAMYHSALTMGQYLCTSLVDVQSCDHACLHIKTYCPALVLKRVTS